MKEAEEFASATSRHTIHFVR